VKFNAVLGLAAKECVERCKWLNIKYLTTVLQYKMFTDTQ